ncbi:hypothetical protein DP145_00150 [Clostridium tetani]|nr:hypothetical protein DP126_11725 [Clostridium tetani]RXI52208.1 hypothetical protein DP122_10155 [Clostridium tetani]RXI53978.1 hypothetical protein DP124_05450 [Clostridium tetani]RXI70782.1 hypothetical protein DP127_09155 [Clostridium tetani]RXI75053.1 hypothetical protein DP128_12240 [Clostridium tetani]
MEDYMKKSFAIFLSTILTAGMLTGCASQSKPSKDGGKSDNVAKEVTISKIGLAHSTSISESKDLGVDKNGKEVLPVAQADETIVAAAFDKDGKVAKVTIDTAQTKVKFDKNLKLTSDLNEKVKTKLERGEEYGMKKVSKIKKEWNEQIAELEKWMIGKTVDEIKGMKVKKRDDKHVSIPDVEELTSLVTISVEKYIAGVEKAYKNAVEVKEGAVKLGLGTEVSIGNSKGLGVDKNGKEVLPMAQVDTTMAATAFDKDGKVVGNIIDTAQTKVEFDKQGKVTTDKKGEFKTKTELGEEYGMKKRSKIKKEWNEQIAEFEKWTVGKTAEEIKGMKVKKRDNNHVAIPDVEELTSLVTMTVEDYIEAVVEANKNAK